MVRKSRRVSELVLGSPQKDPSKLLRTSNDGKVAWKLLPVVYYPLRTAEYVTAILVSDWLYFSRHGVNIHTSKFKQTDQCSRNVCALL